MHFEVHVVEPQTLQQCYTEVKKSPDGLTDASYNQLLYPSIADKPKLFSAYKMTSLTK